MNFQITIFLKFFSYSNFNKRCSYNQTFQFGYILSSHWYVMIFFWLHFDYFVSTFGGRYLLHIPNILILPITLIEEVSETPAVNDNILRIQSFREPRVVLKRTVWWRWIVPLFYFFGIYSHHCDFYNCFYCHYCCCCCC